MFVLVPPVDAEPTRAFHYAQPFARGQHRGIDFPARRGVGIAAPCSGPVTFDGPTPHGRALTLQCRSFKVTLLGVTTRRRHATRGRTIGRATTTEIHLGVRRANDRLGYIDPAPLLRSIDRPAQGPPPVRPIRPPAPRRAVPLRATRPAQPPVLAPWPVWLGLTCVAAAARTRARRRAAEAAARNTLTRPWPST